jgi:hypothetical protein
MKIDAEGGRPVSPVIDLLDGSYLRTFNVKGKGDPRVAVSVGTETWSAAVK